MRNLIVLAVIAIVLAVQVHSADAAMVPMIGHWPDLHLTYRFSDVSACNQIGMTEAIRTAMHEWEVWLNQTIFTENDTSAQIIYTCSLQYSASREDVGPTFDPNSFYPGETAPYFSDNDPNLLVRVEVTFFASAASAPVTVAAHELGHVLGLRGDYTGCSSLMCTGEHVSQAAVPKAPTQDDIDTLKAVYGSVSQTTTTTTTSTTNSTSSTNSTTPPVPPTNGTSSSTASGSEAVGQPVIVGVISSAVNMANAPWAALSFAFPVVLAVVLRRRERKREATQFPADTLPPPKMPAEGGVTEAASAEDLKTLPPLREMQERYEKGLPVQTAQSPRTPPRQVQVRTLRGPVRRATGYLESITVASNGITVATIEPTFITASPTTTYYPVTAEVVQKLRGLQGVDEASGERGIVDFYVQDGSIVDANRRPTPILNNIPERKHTPHFNRQGKITPILSPFDPNSREPATFECLLRSICMIEDLDWERVLASRKRGLDNWRKGWSVCTELAPWAADGFRWAAVAENWKALQPTPELLWKMRGRGIIIFAHPTMQHAVAYEAGKIYDPYMPQRSPERLEEVIARWPPERDWHIKVVIPQPFKYEAGEKTEAEADYPLRSLPSVQDLKPQHQRYCRYCGTHLTPELFCPHCQKFIDPE
jgi:hypothetical protein